MKQDFKLYLDENGVSNLNHHDKNFTLCGVIVKKYQSDEMRIVADQIKFKYWNRTDIIFHSQEMHAKTGDFSILNDPNVRKNFHRDIINFLNMPFYRCIVVSVDKEKAKTQGWDSGKILDEANDKVIEMFLKFLVRQKTASRGRIVLESSSTQDIAFYKRYAYYLSHGYPLLGLSHDDIKETLTSISFVSKRNHDIEAQIADLLAYPATQKFLQQEGIASIVAGSQLEKMCNTMSSKIAELGPNTTNKAYLRLPI